MFDLKRFHSSKTPYLEMGRSFLIKSYQKSYLGLNLLWKGIGAFVCLFLRYKRLYGTVSLSKMYDIRSIALIKKVLLDYGLHHENIHSTLKIQAKKPFKALLHHEVLSYLQSTPLTFNQLSTFVASIETDHKTLPVLLKHYYRLGAYFHSMGIDSNFNDTPGLLLSVHLPSTPDKSLNRYLGKNKQHYLDYISKTHLSA
jgi:putative hemolysin